MSRLAVTHAALGRPAQHPVFAPHLVIGGDRAEVGALVQRHRPGFVGGQVSEPTAV